MLSGLQSSPFGPSRSHHERALPHSPSTKPPSTPITSSATPPTSTPTSLTTIPTTPAPTTFEPPVILPLSPAVINRIAAGEVIHRPANALKELIENSIDAHATRLTITLRDGGLRQLTLTDNGTGIRRDDLPIVCRRFTTSKIKAYDDLQTVATFGFRGEALASITHVAHVTITSMTRDSTCAYKAHYSDGELTALRPGESAQPRPCAGVRGTTIVADDLFYNVPIRRQALKSPADEYARCLDVVTKYAIHYSGIAFSCKKVGGGGGGAGVADVNTMVGASVLDNLRALYGPTVSKELVAFECRSTTHHFRLSGYVSNANYHVKRLQLLLFVNGRLVEHTGIKQTLTTLYARYLPKHTHPFCYVSVEVRGEDVDVNVHPTKREVSLLHEDELMDELERCVDGVLKTQDSSRVFYTQRLMTDSSAGRSGAVVDGENEWLIGREEKAQEAKRQEEMMPMDGDEEDGDDEEWTEEGRPSQRGQAVDEEKVEQLVSLTQIGREKRVYRPNKLVRTDARQGKLQSFFGQPSSQSVPFSVQSASPTTAASPLSPTRKRTHSSVVATDLSSVHNLLSSLSAASLPALSELFADHTFVGLVNATYSVIQHKTALYLINHTRLSQHLVYHHTLHCLTTHRTLRLSTPVAITDMLALRPPSLSQPVDTQAVTRLLEFRAMLMDYFGLQLDDSGSLVGIPELLPHYTPPLLALPLFVHELCTAVEWTDEERCLHGIARCLASWYRIQPTMYIDTDTEAELDDKLDMEAKEGNATTAAAVDGSGVEDELPRAVRWCIEHSLFPACRRPFNPPRTWLSDGTLTQLASLENLYKIFERC